MEIQRDVTKWLTEENIKIVDLSDSDANFHLKIFFPDEQNVIDILQPKNKNDLILLLSGTKVESPHIEVMKNTHRAELERFLLDFRDKLNIYPTDFYFEQSELILNRFIITYTLFKDGLTKDHFFQALRWVLKSKFQGIWEIQKRFGIPEDEWKI
jgi:hypothetical protein